jgi:serine protease inhibitor
MRLGSRTCFGVLTAASVTAALAGCGSTAAPAPAPVAAVTRGVAAVEPAADPRPFGAADTAFGLDVLRDWCAQYPGRNLVFSPSTLASALGMAYLGARGATATAMADVLDLPPGDGAALAAGLQARSRALSALDGPGVTLAASNQVWADPTLTTRPPYLDSVATGYDAGLAQAPFSTNPAKAAAEINSAISAQTRGHITNLVTPGSLAQIGWVLTSALYLDAKWATPFAAGKTQPGTFTPAGAKPVAVPFLNGAGFRYAAAGGWQAVALPYQGGKLTMTALLPPAGSAGCALPGQQAMTAITAALTAGGGPGDTVLAMPKVNLRVGGPVGDMAAVLKRLGMGTAFGAAADFTGLSPEAGGIGFVQQAATLQVGEQGTVGSAAAAVGVQASAAMAGGHYVTFDRPYLLVVSAKSTGEPLFLAEVANPAST